MSDREILAAFEEHLITAAEAVEQACVVSIEELVEAVHPEFPWNRHAAPSSKNSTDELVHESGS